MILAFDKTQLSPGCSLMLTTAETVSAALACLPYQYGSAATDHHDYGPDEAVLA